MKCFVYKSSMKVDTYIYLDQKDDFTKIPKKLLELLGEPKFTLEFDLIDDRKLAVADARQVIANLKVQGYYLQIPPQNKLPS